MGWEAYLAEEEEEKKEKKKKKNKKKEKKKKSDSSSKVSLRRTEQERKNARKRGRDQREGGERRDRKRAVGVPDIRLLKSATQETPPALRSSTAQSLYVSNEDARPISSPLVEGKQSRQANSRDRRTVETGEQ